ncbi:hypothetical protein QQX98_007239 [Neonectria punicea]|uniref:Uncharacterized protein n=1 Tax=Neonectria punicea TaxID=979145 RepID=A0ABR1GYW3_9HYPO
MGRMSSNLNKAVSTPAFVVTLKGLRRKLRNLLGVDPMKPRTECPVAQFGLLVSKRKYPKIATVPNQEPATSLKSGLPSKNIETGPTLNERQEATWEIEKLQTEINHREEDLNKTCVLLSEKENEIKDALDRCQKLEDKEHQATDENQRLSGEIESLRDQLGKSEEYGAELKAKYNAYREKLNEAIAEQQALFTRSKLFYRKARKELEKERSKRTTDTEAIDGALEASRNKREELKNCLEELRTQTEQEGRKKDQIVSELEAKLREQEAELTRERDSAIELRQRIEENKTVQETVTRVESQVQALLENSTYSDANDQKQTEVTSQLSTKLDRILEHLNSSTNNAVTPAAIEPIIERLERKIISRILPAVLTVISGQTQAEESFEKLTGDVLTRLTQIQSDVADGDERRSQYEQSEEATGRDILDHLVRIDARTANAEKTYKQTERQFADWTHSEARQRESFEASFRDQITEQLGDRDFVLGELEQKLHSVVEDYSNKIDSMKDLILQSDEEAKKHLQGAIDAIRHTLENGFKEESARTEREISQSEGIRAALEIHLKEVREKLAVPSRSDPNSGALRHELDEERQTVIELRQKLAQLESEATTNENIHERWQQDIKAIGMMRDQLNEMSGRVPDMTSLEAKFQNMAQINQVMDSTAKYLMAERSWVSQQLGVKTKLDDPSIKADGERQEPQAGDLEREVIASNPQLVVTDTQAISVKSESATDISFQDESTSRKVVVYSPRGDAVSPSPPPSIAQEQLRRREAALPRSILRVTPSSQETTQESIPRIPPNHSKYNRPVTGKVSSTAASAKQGVIDQIRFGLVQPKPVQKSWDLTTVADFERNIKPGRDRAGAKEKKHLLIPTERVESPSPKKVKTESGSSQTGAVLKDRQQRQKPAKNPRILKTYSRKQINEE